MPSAFAAFLKQHWVRYPTRKLGVRRKQLPHLLIHHRIPPTLEFTQDEQRLGIRRKRTSRIRPLVSHEIQQ